MATRHFPPSPPIFSYPHPQQPPFQPHIPPASSSVPSTQAHHPAIPPTAPPTQPPSGNARVPCPWSPSSQSLQPGSYGGVSATMSPLELGSGTTRSTKEAFEITRLSPLPRSVARSPPAGSAIGVQGIVGDSAGTCEIGPPQIPMSVHAQAATPSSVAQTMHRLHFQAPGLNASAYSPTGLSPIPSMIGLGQGKGLEQEGDLDKVTSYLLSPATAGVVGPPGQVSQVASTVGDARYGYEQDVAMGPGQGVGPKVEKAEDKMLDLHKAYRELIDGLHEDFVKERRIWVEERKLYEFRIGELERRIKALQSSINSTSVRRCDSHEHEIDREKEKQEGTAKWEPPPPIPHPSGLDSSTIASSWTETGGSLYDSQSQTHHFQHYSDSLSGISNQIPCLSSFPAFPENVMAHPYPPSGKTFGYSYSHSYGSAPSAYSYPRPPTREELSHPERKKEKEKRPSSRVSFTNPVTAKSHAYSVSPPESGGASAVLEPAAQVQEESKERKHTFPIPPPLAPESPSSQEHDRTIGGEQKAKPTGEQPKATSEDNCDPEPILKSPSSKAVGIFSPIPRHKIDPLYISPSPARGSSPLISSKNAGDSEDNPLAINKEVSAWRARSKSPGAVSEGGRSEVSDHEIKLVLKKNTNFGSGLSGWGFNMSKLNLDERLGGERGMGNGEEAEFGYGEKGAGGWKTPKGEFSE